jgi:uncharacterized membrane protein
VELLKTWAVGVVVFLAIDLAWLGVVANEFYRREMGHRLRMDGSRLTPRLVPEALLYALLVLGLAVFAVPRARCAGQAWLYGALFGLVAYGVYDLTNYSTLVGFSLRVALVDLAWGTLLTGTVAAAMYLTSQARAA